MKDNIIGLNVCVTSTSAFQRNSFDPIPTREKKPHTHTHIPTQRTNEVNAISETLNATQFFPRLISYLISSLAFTFNVAPLYSYSLCVRCRFHNLIWFAVRYGDTAVAPPQPCVSTLAISCMNVMWLRLHFIDSIFVVVSTSIFGWPVICDVGNDTMRTWHKLDFLCFFFRFLLRHTQMKWMQTNTNTNTHWKGARDCFSVNQLTVWFFCNIRFSIYNFYLFNALSIYSTAYGYCFGSDGTPSWYVSIWMWEFWIGWVPASPEQCNNWYVLVDFFFCSSCADCRLSSVAQNSCNFAHFHNVSSFFIPLTFFPIFFFFSSPFQLPISIVISDVNATQQNSDILSLGTGAVSWFEVNGYGCVPTYPTNITSEDPFRLVRPEYVDGCLLEWYTVEIIQSAVQLCLAVTKKRNIFRFTLKAENFQSN